MEPACQSAAAIVLGESVLEGFDLEPNFVSWVLPPSLPRVLVLCYEAGVTG